MTVKLGRNTVLEEGIFKFTVAKAANRRDDYIKALVAGLKEHEVPVDRRLDSVKGPGISLDEAVILTPTEKRLRKTFIVHYAKPMGASLEVGDLPCPGDAFPAAGTMRAQWGVGGLKSADIDNFINLVMVIRDFCVEPAIEHIAGQPMPGSSGGGGFFGS